MKLFLVGGAGIKYLTLKLVLKNIDVQSTCLGGIPSMKIKGTAFERCVLEETNVEHQVEQLFSFSITLKFSPPHSNVLQLI